MRQIMFRAWDNVRNTYSKVKSINCHNNTVTVYDDENDPISTVTDEIGIIELEQFTGLQDKNGVDIYEGDIVKIDDCYDAVGQFAGARAVYYNHGGFRLKPKWNPEAAGNYLDCCEYLTVIGNIHQNKELLDEVL